MSSVVINVRIPRGLKEEAEKLGINIDEVARRALEEEVIKAKYREARDAAKELGRFFARRSPEEWTEIIKEGRKGR